MLADPRGTHFVDPEQKGVRPVGKAHLFVNSDMPRKFADQFAPFKVFGFDPARWFNGGGAPHRQFHAMLPMVFGFDPARGFNGTLIRLPLKHDLCDSM
ncbi:hypothetical protein T484DRAFT_1828081, partial [Baffinella frigidus]